MNDTTIAPDTVVAVLRAELVRTAHQASPARPAFPAGERPGDPGPGALNHPDRAADDGHLAAGRDTRAVSLADRVRQLDRRARVGRGYRRGRPGPRHDQQVLALEEPLTA